MTPPAAHTTTGPPWCPWCGHRIAVGVLTPGNIVACWKRQIRLIGDEPEARNA